MVYKIGIVILQWNNSADTIACVHSVLEIDYPHFEIILVDNGSKVEERDAVQAAFPTLHMVQNEKNLGYAEGNNGGIREALKRGADYILLLNNDTTVDRGILRAFTTAAEENPDAGVFGAKIYYFDEPTVIWHAGGNVHLKTLRCYHEGCPQSDLDKKHEEIKETAYACGCALFVRKEAIEKTGLMDPTFFLLWEEIDWCYRIRSAGYRCLFVPKAKVWHKISRSFKGGNRGPAWQYFYFRNRLLFIERHIPWKRRLPFYTTTLLKEMAEIAWMTVHPRTPSSTRSLNRSALKGIRDYFRRRFNNSIETVS